MSAKRIAVTARSPDRIAAATHVPDATLVPEPCREIKDPGRPGRRERQAVKRMPLIAVDHSFRVGDFTGSGIAGNGGLDRV